MASLLPTPILYFRCQPVQKARLLVWCERQGVDGLSLDPLINDDKTLGLPLAAGAEGAVLAALKGDLFLHRFCDFATIVTHEFLSFQSLLDWEELSREGVAVKLTVMPNKEKERLIKELPESVSLTSSDSRTHFLFATSDPRPRQKKQAYAPKEEMKYLASLTAAQDTYPVYSSARYEEDPHICRAYWKLAEVFSMHPTIFVSGGNAIDVGSSPGGWTESLLENGAGKVIGIDPGAMDERLKAVVFEDPEAHVEGSPKVTHLKMQAEKTTGFVSTHMPEGVDLLVCDANMSPETVHTMLRPLARLVKVGGHMVLTLKLVNGAKSANRCLREAADRFNGWKMIWGGHAMNNKGKERTVIFVKELQEEETVQGQGQEHENAEGVGEKQSNKNVVKSAKFWEEYHKANPEVDWITSPANIIGHIVGKDDKNILEVGCGTSELSKEMASRLKSSKFTSTDVSPAAVSTCASRYKDVENLKYEVLDLLGDVQGKGTWDVVVDKGCLDTFMFRSPAQERLKHVTTALDNIHTLLCPGGRYVVVSPRANLQARFGGVGWRLKDWMGWKSVTRRKVKCEVSLEGRTGVGDVYIYACIREDSYDPKAEGWKFKEQDEGPEVCPGCGKDRGVRIGRGFRQWRNHVSHCMSQKEKEGRKRMLSEGGEGRGGAGGEGGGRIRGGGGASGEETAGVEKTAGEEKTAGVEKTKVDTSSTSTPLPVEPNADDITGFWNAWNKAHVQACQNQKEGECSCFEGQGAIM